MNDEAARPRFNPGVALLADLYERVASFTAREERLTRELSTKRSAFRRQQREQLEALENAAAAETQQSEEEFAAREAALRAAHEQRRARIARAHKNQVGNILVRARRKREKYIGDLQMRRFQAERQLPGDLQAADAAYAEFGASLEEQRLALESVSMKARRAFSGHHALWPLLQAPPSTVEAGEQDALLERLRALLEQAEAEVEQFRRHGAVLFFHYVPLPLLLMAGAIAGVALAFMLGLQTTALAAGGGLALTVAVTALVVHRLTVQALRPAAEKLATIVLSARATYDACSTAAHDHYEQTRGAIQARFDELIADVEQRWSGADEVERQHTQAARARIERQLPRLRARHEAALAPRLAALAREREERQTVTASTHTAERAAITERERSASAALELEVESAWRRLEEDWQREVTPLYSELMRIHDAHPAPLHAWSAEGIEAWQPSTSFSTTVRIGRVDLDLSHGAGAVPKQAALALPGPATVSTPIALDFPEHGSLLFETKSTGDGRVVGTLNNVILRLLSTTPPGKLNFTIIDPVGLGQNFAGLMHLADYEEHLIDRRIWTQREQIEERLAELADHIEKVIQMYLRNEFATITDYNTKAGTIAEKYHYLVIADFPANFSETAAKRLQSIVVSGPRCGVFTLIHWDRRHPAPEGLVAEELRRNSVWIQDEGGRLTLGGQPQHPAASLHLDPPPTPELAAALVHKIGKASVDSNRVEVPFTQVAPKPDELWKEETTSELRVAIGRTGATKLQHLAIGKGTRQHALFAGKTGSGKSTLFHVIITNLALTCSPEQVEFYLIDFKKGVEFKCYATQRLPHARVVAIESDREFGLSVLQRVDEELRRRGDLFRKLGVQDIPGYKRAGGTESMPRSLLLIDEFQEFFVEDDAVAQTASVLFDRIVRQGRAFGIHVLLGSQTLGGAYTLARTTMGQMVIRVALQCNEADAYLIMDDNNPAPRLLSRPGEGIYNDAAGAVEGNSPFQVVWLDDEERDAWLERVSAQAEQSGKRYPSPIVFEGNAPADVEENDDLKAALEQAPTAAPHEAFAWLGAPNSIKGPTAAAFRRQSGNNLLVVGQREEAATNMLAVAMLSLAAQHPPGTAKFYLVHSAAPGSHDAALFAKVAAALAPGLKEVRGHELPETIDALAAELKTRAAGEASSSEAATVETPRIFLFVHGIQRFKKLRPEDDFSFGSESTADAATQFGELIAEGSANGIHVITTVDTFTNMNRFLTRKALANFEMRVVFQMSANDSASIIDSPRASALGLHRALLYNEHASDLETFRPYATPEEAFLEKAAARLTARTGVATVLE